MARVSQDKAYRTFVKGFITEATGLNFPENSCRDIDNCEIELKGSVRRRQGLNQEAGGFAVGAGLLVAQPYQARKAGKFSLLPAAGTQLLPEELAVTANPWSSPGGRSDLNFIVFQIGNILLVRNWDSDPISDASSISTYVTGTTQFNLDDTTTGYVYNTSWMDAAKIGVQSSAGFGRLWITSSAIIPAYLDYNPETKQITLNKVGVDNTNPQYFEGRMSIRDFSGVKDGYNNDTQPDTLTPEHKYNLFNQGWGDTQINAYFASQMKYPSNAQQWIIGKNATDDFDPSLLTKQDFGNSRAPRGRKNMHALFGDRDGVFTSIYEEPVGTEDQGINFGQIYDKSGTTNSSTFNNLPGERATKSFTSVAFFAGRVWFAGDQNAYRPNGVYFSKTLQRVEDAGIYQQENDPTSEHFSDLLDTDGGVIYVTEATFIRKLVPYESGLLVLADNGIWFIYGGEGTGGFSATNYACEKVTSTGILGANTVAVTGQQVVFFAENSVHALQLPERGSLPQILDLAETTIFTYYGQIPRQARATAQACYDPISKRVFWSWLSAPTYNYPAYQNAFNKMLVFDTRTGAFSKHSFNVNVSSLRTNSVVFPKRTVTRFVTQDSVLIGADTVTVGNDSVLVYSQDSGIADFLSSIKILMLSGSESALRIGELYDSTFIDYANVPGFTPSIYTSYMVSGDETLGDLERKKQATLLFSYFLRTEIGFAPDSNGDAVVQKPSACTVVARWDWHNTGAGGKWSLPQQAYRYRRTYVPNDSMDTLDNGEEILHTRLKIRGSGKSLSLRYESVGQNDFKLLGYAIPFTAEANV